MNASKLFPILIFISCVSAIQAQVGIGTTSPTAELEILGTDTGIPALKLNPQSAPVGVATGQLAVIGDILYMYDATRVKWLSVESTVLQFGYFGDANNQSLLYSGLIEDLGPIMPKDGTIVYVTINSSGGNASKRFDIKLDGVNIGNSGDPTLDGRIDLSSGIFSYDSFNIDFTSGQHISINARIGTIIYIFCSCKGRTIIGICK